jgi:hypothetical protein
MALADRAATIAGSAGDDAWGFAVTPQPCRSAADDRR